ncbi:MAG: hypothetical protein C9355_06035 [Thalassolituus maritimus]|uniref:Uncharacterized protein n=1 Tax=Thalassolituus maritimus TaxID=484498 RepID=A0A1N7IY27_9GAMM|nr:hypothetical protein [Thalassolituus maritimus]TPD54897.1 MAG: hypothetical protein C9355_06035 [Thalassolituus maritimus]SIS42022.1 hypothetical protein SAMN05421686_101135 [Thalassolituus maritimus]
MKSSRSFFEVIAALFGEPSNITERETTAEYIYSYQITTLKSPDKSVLESKLRSLLPIAKSTTISIDSDIINEKIFYSGCNETIEEKISLLSDILSDQESEENVTNITIKLDKKTDQRELFIINPKALVDFWDDGGIYKSLEKINTVILNYDQLIIPNSDESIRRLRIGSNTTRRNNILSKRRTSCHFSNESQFSLIPEDFDFIESIEADPLKCFFRKIKFYCLLTFICDYSRLDANSSNLIVALNGYKYLQTEIDQQEEIAGAIVKEYHQIYKWIYSEGDTSDKIGLARNIISIHSQDDSLIFLRSGTMKSILSGYQIYLKENIKQYIEIKNKLSDHIHDSSLKAMNIANGLASYLKNSIFSLVSFFISVILIRLLAQKETKVVSDDVYIIFIMLLVISTFVLFFSIYEINTEIKRFDLSYSKFKNRYKELLNKDDLSRILDNDEQHLSDMTYLQEKKISYTAIWSIILFLLFVVISCMWAFFEPPLPPTA